jgi:cytosine/adenosine deaminase-related metal-dependent hydrolase
MILENITIKGSEGEKQIVIQENRISAVYDNPAKTRSLNDGIRIMLENAVAFPGLVNSHDHLDFNLFPQLANRHYPDYTEWANEIHQTNQATIQNILKIPQHLRIEWGCYKNLLNGFTTVVNHGKKLKINHGFISVYQDCYPLHSVAFEKNWKWKLNNPFRNGKPFVMHIGEGVNEAAGKEINEVIRWNYLSRKKMIAVHGIAMTKKQATAFKGLVWCPASNYLLTGQTADVYELGNTIPVVFGTDSTLSAGWNAWDHFRQALNNTGIRETQLLKMLTTEPVALWSLDHCGVLAENAIADIVVARKKTDFFSLDPEDVLLVIHRGIIRLYDEEIAGQLNTALSSEFSRIRLGEHVKYITGDLPGLMDQVYAVYPEARFPVVALS